jgi:hypothetical protein
MNITYTAHIECGGPEEVARASDELSKMYPGKVGSTMPEDAKAWGLYGPC